MEIIDLRRFIPLDQKKSGARRLLYPVLLPLWALYARGIWLWRELPARAADVGVPVVSVGSILVGGSGKTPLTMLIARGLFAKGRKVCIISRGYKRTSKCPIVVASDTEGLRATLGEVGDEAYLMAKRLPGVPVVVSRDRLAAARRALSAFRPEVIVLDDGFQVRRMAKAVEIITLDTASLRSRQSLLPLGRLREGWNRIRPEHMVVIVAGRGERRPDPERVARVAARAVFYASYDATAVLDVDGKPVDRGAVLGAKCLVMSGIGSPARFERTCEEAGIEAVASVRMDDHHWYTEADGDTVLRLMEKYGSKRLVTTEKDLARLPVNLRDICWTLRAEVRMENEPAFWSELNQRLGG